MDSAHSPLKAPTSGFSTWTQQLYKGQFTKYDVISASILKAVSDAPGYPKIKHVKIIKDALINREIEVSQMLMILSTVEWKDNIVVSCKILMLLSNFLNSSLITVMSEVEDSYTFLNIIESSWSECNNNFICSYILFLKSKMSFQKQYKCGLELMIPADDNTAISMLLSSLRIIANCLSLVEPGSSVSKNSSSDEFRTCLSSLIEFSADLRRISYTIYNSIKLSENGDSAKNASFVNEEFISCLQRIGVVVDDNEEFIRMHELDFSWINKLKS